jgi:hypothetical protein
LNDDTREALVNGVCELRTGGCGSWISRESVFGFVNSPHGSEIDGFVAVMAWGHGMTGYGWWRTSRVASLRLNTLCRKITGQIGAARDTPAAAFAAWDKGPDRIRYLGTAFASKLAYLAVPEASGQDLRPLIADNNTAWAFWAFTGEIDTRTSRDQYVEYVRTLHDWARATGSRPDAFQRALFLLGPEVIGVWSGRWRMLECRPDRPDVEN